MRPHSRKEKEVWQACDQLGAEGLLITYEAIGERLLELGYKRGSNSDIHRYLNTWKSIQTQQQIAEQVPDSPPGSFDQLQSAIDHMRQEIWLEATKALKDCQQTLAVKEKQLGKAQNLNHELKSALETKNKKIELLETQHNHVEALDEMIIAVKELAENREQEISSLYDKLEQQLSVHIEANEQLKQQNAKLKRMLHKHKAKSTKPETENS